MGGAEVIVRRLGRPGDLGWVIMAHGELYAAEYGWDSSFEALVARIVADYAGDHDPSREAAWIAEIDGQRVGCIFCVAGDDDGGGPEGGGAVDDGGGPDGGGTVDRRPASTGGATAQLRILLVHPDARGHGLGGRLVDTCLGFARDAGYASVRLWTNHPLVAARQIYLRRGFTLTDEQPHHSFGVDLIGQTYELDLRATVSSAGPAGARADEG